MDRPILILASASPRRRDLLGQIGVIPDSVSPADIDETPCDGEKPDAYAERLGREKASEAARRILGEPVSTRRLVLAADTAVAVGRRILPKTEEEHEALDCLRLMSGRSHRVYTGVALADIEGGIVRRLSHRLVETRVKVARLTPPEIDAYIASGEWRGKAGGYGVQGRFSRHIVNMIGSYTNVVGLPLYETANLLKGAGYPVE